MSADPAPEPRPLVVAVDGPSGSGKSSVSKALAGALRIGYLDTGAMYRAATWWCRHEGIKLTDEPAVTHAVRTMPLVIGLGPADPTITVAGVDVAQAIRSPELTAVVSLVATNLAVRAVLRDRQRALIQQACGQFGGVVAEGRDITTVVAPDADVRILLTADVAARLARRALELHGHAGAGELRATRDQIVTRDAQDGTVSSFVTAAAGVTSLDTTDLDLAGSVAAARAIVADQAPWFTGGRA